MSKPSLMFNPKAGGDVEANLDFASDGLTVFDREGRKLQHWLYPEIIHAHQAGDRKDEVLAHSSRPEIRLQVPDLSIYAAIQERAPQLRRRTAASWWMVWDAIPEEFHFALFLAIFGSSAVGLYLSLHLIGW